MNRDFDEEAARDEAKDELDDPLPRKLQDTVTARLKNDAVVCTVLAVAMFSLHCSTVFTVLQPEINHVLHSGACILGFLVHYIIPQLRKHLPWLCIAKPILKPDEFGLFEVQNLSKIMWFETMYVVLCFFERNILFPLIFVSSLTADSGLIVGKFGLTLGTVLIVVCSLKCKSPPVLSMVVPVHSRSLSLSIACRRPELVLRCWQPVHHTDLHGAVVPVGLQNVQ